MIFKKGNTILILVIVLGILLFAFLWFSGGTEIFRTKPKETAPSITTSSELDSVGKDLDTTDVNQMDSELKQLDSDTNF